MDTFGLRDLFQLVLACVLIGLVSALGPPIWRALPALVGRYTERRMLHDLVNALQPELSDVREDYVTHKPQTAPDGQQTDRQTPVSAADPYLERLRLDRTRKALIDVMIYTGWSVGEIRGVLKGDNTVLSAEIEQARRAQGIAAPPRVIPHVERGAPPRALVLDDPDLRYERPPA